MKISNFISFFFLFDKSGFNNYLEYTRSRCGNVPIALLNNISICQQIIIYIIFFQDPKSLPSGLPANLVSLMSKGALGATKLTEVSKTSKMETETPAQKQAAAKLALRKQLEKTLLQVSLKINLKLLSSS